MPSNWPPMKLPTIEPIAITSNQHEAAIFTENDKAAIPTVTREPDQHRGQADDD